jgi:hypothetical protein
MKILYAILLTAGLFTFPAHSGITRISNGGVNISLSELLPGPAPMVVVFHTPWDKASIDLLKEIESWAEHHANLAIFFVDVVDERTQVYRQYSLSKVPSILIFDARQEQAGGTVHDLESLEDVLNSNSLL